MQSMTAYARSDIHLESHHWICEMRSVNHRYLELGLNVPEALRAFEMNIREMVRGVLKRGKIEFNLKLIPSAGMVFSTNPQALQALQKATQTVQDVFISTADINPLEVLKFPQILNQSESGFQSLPDSVETLIEKTLDALVAARSREGKSIREFIWARLQALKLELAKVYRVFPDVLEAWKDKIHKKLNEANMTLSQERLEQEFVLYAQRMDIAEECARLSVHIEEMENTLDQDEAVGRRLDFLTQELNREANTIGSKSMHANIAHAVVEMKVLIEQIREQIQNVE